ncbi:MAG: hypothetical protein M1812_001742 [Candelaria pacifica]|nr:MAG: hypothetical protein M1812_001742 [Candelaria pacifica]
MTKYTSLFSALALSAYSLASPLPNPESAPPICIETDSYSITSQEQYTGPTGIVTGFICPSYGTGAQCSLGESVSYAVTVTITVGADLSLDISEILSAGISASVAVGKTTTNGVATNQQCPPWHVCGLQATPQLYRVQGYKTPTYGTGRGCGGKAPGEYYDISVPVLVSGAQANANAYVEYSICGVPGKNNTGDGAIPTCPTYP